MQKLKYRQLVLSPFVVDEGDMRELMWVCEFDEQKFPLPINYYAFRGQFDDPQAHICLLKAFKKRSRAIDRFLKNILSYMASKKKG